MLSFKEYMELKKHLPGFDYNKIHNKNTVCSINDINLDYFNPQERTREIKLPLSIRNSSFKEVHLGYNSANARAESERCFHCGKCTQCQICCIFCPDISIHINSKSNGVTVDYDFCKGCGICSEECPRGVIQMKREVIK